jgi:hypothetical protein
MKQLNHSTLLILTKRVFFVCVRVCVFVYLDETAHRRRILHIEHSFEAKSAYSHWTDVPYAQFNVARANRLYIYMLASMGYWVGEPFIIVPSFFKSVHKKTFLQRRQRLNPTRFSFSYIIFDRFLPWLCVQQGCKNCSTGSRVAKVSCSLYVYSCRP